MRRIVQEVTPIIDDTSQLEQYAHWYHLIINEIVYYSNAREYSGDEGLERSATQTSFRWMLLGRL